MSTKIQKPSIGRIVEVTLRDIEGDRLVHRPAIVVSTNMGGDDGINCQVFLDGTNDAGVNIPGRTAPDQASVWLTSVHHNADGALTTSAFSWRYPPRVTDEIEVST